MHQNWWLQCIPSVGLILHGAVVTEKVIAVTSRAVTAVKWEKASEHNERPTLRSSVFPLLY